MTSEELKNKSFIGVVEDNNDPKKLGRIKVRVLNVFDEIPVEDIPWASSWKDLNGNAFNVPDVGKVVSVVFDSGNKYKPEYIHASHFNKNLEEKLKELSDSDYISMRALVFDHKTQVYSNDTEGLKIDYKFNNINIKEDSIDVNLKDNFGHVNIGTPTANQQAILGNNFLNWFDEFIDNLIGTNSGPYLGNLGAPVLANPEFIDCLTKYKSLRDPKFLSHHVNIVDNEYVDKQDRIADGQIGDKWVSTVGPNKNTTSDPINYKAKDGNSTDTPDGDLTTHVDENGNVITGTDQSSEVGRSDNPDVQKIIAAMQKKGYKILTKPYEMNIVAIRRQYEGMLYSNSFKDDLHLIYKTDDSNNWVITKYKISTMPGFYKAKEVNGKPRHDESSNLNVKQLPLMLKRGTAPNNGQGILMEAQYLNIYEIGEHIGTKAMKSKGPQKFYRDNSPGNVIKYTGKGEGYAGMLIHRGYPGGSAVNNFSEGCQIFSNSNDLNSFFDLCEKHKSRYGNNFNYTLMLERDL